jgi:putative aldouronate transport system substrate-binding protein
MKRKMFALLLVLFALVNGWSNGGQEEGSDVAGKISVNKTGFPIVDEMIEMDAVINAADGYPNWNNLELYQDYEKLTNVKINWQMIPIPNITEKMNLMMAAGDLPDFAVAPLAFDTNKTAEAASEGLILPLNQLISDWAPNISKIFEEKPYVMKAMIHPDGNIYNLFVLKEQTYHGLVRRQWYINVKWLKHLGMDMPGTPEELKVVLQAFKDQDVNENGDPSDEIPMGFWTADNGDIREWITRFGAWGVCDEVMIDNGIASWGFMDPGFKEGLKYFKNLASLGLLDNQSIVQSRNQIRSRAQNEAGDPLLGLSYALAPQWLLNNPDFIYKYDPSISGPTKDDLVLNDKLQYWVMPPLKGPKGDQLWQFYEGYGLFTSRVVLFKDNKYPEATIRWFDTWYDGGEWGLQCFVGKKGVTWELSEANQYHMFPTPDGMNKNQFQQSHGFSANFGYYSENGPIGEECNPGHQQLEEQTDIYIPYAPDEPWIPQWIIPTGEEAQFLSQYETELMVYVQEMIAKFIFTDIDVDKEWDNYLEQCHKLKSDDVLRIKQTQYNRYMNTK